MGVVGLLPVVGFRADLKSPHFSYFAIGSFSENPPQPTTGSKPTTEGYRRCQDS